MSVLSLDEAKDHLNYDDDDLDDAEIAATIDAAEAAIAKMVGPLEPTTFTSVIDCGGGSLTLPQTPVISLTTITAVPLAYAGWWGSLIGLIPGPEALSVNPVTGVVTVLSYNFPSGLLPGRYTITYVAGREDTPEDLLYAVKEMVRHLWASQRGSAALPGQGGGDTPTPGYLFPNRVAELLQPHKTRGLGMI